ncbi:MAG: M48 family metallopeptidase [Burkholderiales bacterium]|jgi:predicted metal-dependent hydrolase|nr:M48 family metallopeptidase [Burkholderiales bacterium]
MTVSTESVRTIALQNTLLSYQLIRASRRSVSIRVEADTVVVRAPRWLAVRDVETALRERAAWIVRSMAWWRCHARPLVSPAWQPDAEVLYRGAMLPLSVRLGHKSEAQRDLLELQVTALSAEPILIEQSVRQWWWREAENILIPQAMTMATRAGRLPTGIRLSRARGQWGSCNSRGEILLNWRLILLPPKLADDVIAHEVAHLYEFNHSPRFWETLETFHPGTRQRRRALAEWAGLLRK